MKTHFNSYSEYLRYLDRNYFSNRWRDFFKFLNILRYSIIFILPFFLITTPLILIPIFRSEIEFFLEALKINPISIFAVALTLYLGTILCVFISLANQKDPIFRQSKLQIFFKISLAEYVNMSLIMTESTVVAISAFIGAFFNFSYSIMYSLILMIYSTIFIAVFIKFAINKNNSQYKMILKTRFINIHSKKSERYFCDFEDTKMSKTDLRKGVLTENILRKFRGETEYVKLLSDLLKHNVTDIYDSFEFARKYISIAYDKRNFVCYENLLSFCLLTKNLNDKIFPRLNNVNKKEYYVDLVNTLYLAATNIFNSKYMRLVKNGMKLVKNNSCNIYDEKIDKQYRNFLYLHLAFFKIAIDNIKDISDKYAFSNRLKKKKMDKVIHDIGKDLKDYKEALE